MNDNESFFKREQERLRRNRILKIIDFILFFFLAITLIGLFFSTSRAFASATPTAPNGSLGVRNNLAFSTKIDVSLKQRSRPVEVKVSCIFSTYIDFEKIEGAELLNYSCTGEEI